MFYLPAPYITINNYPLRTKGLIFLFFISLAYFSMHLYWHFPNTLIFLLSPKCQEGWIPVHFMVQPILQNTGSLLLALLWWIVLCSWVLVLASFFLFLFSPEVLPLLFPPEKDLRTSFSNLHTWLKFQWRAEFSMGNKVCPSRNLTAAWLLAYFCLWCVSPVPEGLWVESEESEAHTRNTRLH